MSDQAPKSRLDAILELLAHPTQQSWEDAPGDFDPQEVAAALRSMSMSASTAAEDMTAMRDAFTRMVEVMRELAETEAGVQE